MNREILGKTDQCYRFPVSRPRSLPWPVRVPLSALTGRRLIAIVLLVVLVLWWWWPGVTGQSTSVTVVVTSDVESAREEIGRRLREEGFSVRWETKIRTWCDLADFDGNPVVVSTAGLADCERTAAEIVDSLSSKSIAHWVVIDLENAGTAMAVEQRLRSKGARYVAVQRLIGDVGEARPCVWWEECDETGRTITRDENGLTADGRDRLARLITAAVV